MYFELEPTQTNDNFWALFESARWLFFRVHPTWPVPWGTHVWFTWTFPTKFEWITACIIIRWWRRKRKNLFISCMFFSCLRQSSLINGERKTSGDGEIAWIWTRQCQKHLINWMTQQSYPHNHFHLFSDLSVALTHGESLTCIWRAASEMEMKKSNTNLT